MTVLRIRDQEPEAVEDTTELWLAYKGSNVTLRACSPGSPGWTIAEVHPGGLRIRSGIHPCGSCAFSLPLEDGHIKVSVE